MLLCQFFVLAGNRFWFYILLCIYVRGSAKMFWPNTSGYIVDTCIISDSVERQSRDKNKHIIVTKDVVGLLLGDVVSTKKHTSSQRMWLACYLES